VVIDTCPILEENTNALGQLLRHIETLIMYQSVRRALMEKLVNESEIPTILF